MIIYEKILGSRLKELVKIDDGQYGFVAGKSTNDAIFIMRRLQRKYRLEKRSLYHIFVDLEKATPSAGSPRKVGQVSPNHK